MNDRVINQLVHKNAIVIKPSEVQSWIEDLIPDNWSKTCGHWLIQDEKYREAIIEAAYKATREFTQRLLNESERDD